MSAHPVEVKTLHTGLLRCTLEVQEARAYWRHVDPAVPPSPTQVFEEYWFGARSMARVEVLLQTFRLRFDAYPEAFAVLHRWRDMEPETRRLVCHWHLQLADPLYRAFTGEYLAARREASEPTVRREAVIAWVSEQGPGRWRISTRTQFASKLLSAAYAAGLVGTRRDPRPVLRPRVTDRALTYLLYLLRGVDFRGTLLENPYLASVGLTPADLDSRLRRLEAVSVRRLGALADFDWRYPSLGAWAEAELPLEAPAVDSAAVPTAGTSSFA